MYNISDVALPYWNVVEYFLLSIVFDSVSFCVMTGTWKTTDWLSENANELTSLNLLCFDREEVDRSDSFT